MVAYAPTPGDMEVGVEDRTVVLVEKKSSTRWIWKMTGALLGALCLGGVLLFVLHWSGRPGSTTDALVGTDAAEKTDLHSTLRRISGRAKAAIHLEGNYEEDGESSNGEVEWTNGQGQAFAQGGFRVVDNQILIPQTGLYFVYSQASFRVSCGGDGEEEEEEAAGRRLTPLSHRIYRYSDSMGRKVSLMSAVRSACQNTAHQEDAFRAGMGWYNAIYLGAVFQLNGGDRLWTETNQLSALETDDGKTFFGVFAL